jgi:hypothetical protein
MTVPALFVTAELDSLLFKIHTLNFVVLHGVIYELLAETYCGSSYLSRKGEMAARCNSDPLSVK